MTTLKEGFREGLFSSQKVQLENTYNELDKRTIKENKIKDLRWILNTYNGKIEDQNLSVPAIQMHHLIWMLLGAEHLFILLLYNLIMN